MTFKVGLLSLAIATTISTSANSQAATTDKVVSHRYISQDARVESHTRPTYITPQTTSNALIVVLEDNAVLKQLPELHSQHLAQLNSTQASKVKSQTLNGLRQRVSRYQQQVQRKQDRLITALTSAGVTTQVTHRFSNTINGLVLANASDSDRQAIEKMPGVKAVYRDIPVQASLQESVAITRAPELWNLDSDELGVTGEGIRVAVLDTGVDYTHPDLGGCLGEGCKVVAGYDFVYGDDDPMDIHGHGTHVAGTVAANGPLYRGVAPDADIMAVKVLGDSGAGMSSDIVAGIEWSVDPDGDPLTDDGAHIINMSLGGGRVENDIMIDAVNTASEAGVLVVVAAGNDGRYGDIQQSSPAAASSAVTVGSSTKADELSFFTSKGESYQGVLKPELVAPGSEIDAPIPGGGYAVFSGTSMASPHVAGAAALLLNQTPDATPEQLKSKLMAGAVDLGVNPYAQGAGRLDLVASSQASFAVNQGGADFGLFADDAQGAVSVTRTLTLNNFTDATLDLALTLQTGTLPASVTFEFADSVSIDAGGEIQVDITMTADDIGAIDFADDDSGAFFGALVISHDSQSLSAPLSFIKTKQITLESQALAPLFLEITDPESNALYMGWLFPEQALTLNTRGGNVTVYGEYMLELDAQLDTVGIDYSQQYPYATGLEVFDLNTDEEDGYTFTEDNLTTVVTSGGGTFVNGESFAAIQTLQTQIAVHNEAQGWLSVISLTFNEPMASVFAIGRTGTDLGVYVTNLDAPYTSDTDNISEVMIHDFALNEATTTHYELDFTTSRKIALPHTGATTAQYSVRPKWMEFGDGTLVPNSISSNATVTFHSSTDQPLTADYVIHKDNDQDAYFSLTSDAFVKANFDIHSEQAINLTGVGAHSGQLMFNNGTVKNYYGAPYRTLQGAELNSDFHAEMSLSCADEVQWTHAYDPRADIELPSYTCEEDIAVELNKYADNTLVSTLRFAFDGDFAVASGVHIDLHHHNQPAPFNQVFDRNGSLFISAADGDNSFNLSDVRYRINDGEWTALAIREEDNGIRARVPLNQGQATADVQVTYDYGSSSVTQTLYGAFMVGNGLTPTEDFDGDGLVNAMDDDDDNDGRPDAFELAHGLDPQFDEGSIDRDGDGLSLYQEYLLGTSDDLLDSDGDGVADNIEVNLGSSPTDAQSQPTPITANHDFDGDGLADVVTYDPITYTFAIHTASTRTNVESLYPSDLNTPLYGDFDGDNIADVALFDSTSGYIDYYSSAYQAWSYMPIESREGDVALTADMDGDKISDLILRRPESKSWLAQLSSTGNSLTAGLGRRSGDLPITGDFDLDGKSDFAVARQETGLWYVKNSSGTTFNSTRNDDIQRLTLPFSQESVPLAYDIDGDFITDIGVYDPATGIVRWLQTSTNSTVDIDLGATEEETSSVVVLAHYDDDGVIDYGLYNAQTGLWTKFFSAADWDTETLDVGVGLDSPLTSAAQRLQAR